MAGPAPGPDNGYPHRGMSPFSPPRRPVSRPPFLMGPVYVRGKGTFLEKGLPSHSHSPIPPKTFMQVCDGPSWRTGRSSSAGLPAIWLKGETHPPGFLRWRKTSGPSLFHHLCPASPAADPAGSPATDALFKRRTILYKIRLLSCLFLILLVFKILFHFPAAQRRGPVIPTKTKVLRGDGGPGEGGRFFQKRPPSPGLASPEARYHAHVRSSPDRGVRP